MLFKRIKTAFADDRGTISDILYNTPVEHSAIITTKIIDGKPVIRGNHYHAETTQHIYILEGSLTYWYAILDPKTLRYEYINQVHVPKGCMVSTPPYEIHALEIWEPTTFIVFSHGVRGGHDYESDTYRVQPILTLENL